MADPRVTTATSGFEGVHRFWDGGFNKTMAKILPGEYYVSEGQDLVTTILGSCVSACVRHVKYPLGAMNHFLLPDAGGDGSAVDAPHRYGAYAMEHMLNELFKKGARKSDLEVKIVGGGAVMQSSARVGGRNIEFVKNYLENEQLRVVSEDVGDSVARRVVYDVTNGRMLVKHLPVEAALAEEESRYANSVASQEDSGGDVELF